MNELPQQGDVVFVCAGHNALVATAYLLAAGRSVRLLEQMAGPGAGCRPGSSPPRVLDQV